MPLASVTVLAGEGQKLSMPLGRKFHYGPNVGFESLRAQFDPSNQPCVL
jgi:hypothetical protein